VIRNGGGDACTGRLLVVALAEAGPFPDHLAKRPEADPLAISWRAPVMEPDGLDESVPVLAELPAEPRLANPGWADDRNEPRSSFADGRVEQVLEEAELLVATDERRFERLRAVPAAALGNDAKRTPRRDGRCLALEGLLADGFEGDRTGCRPLRRLADEDGAGSGGPLEAAGSIDDVTGDHAFVRGPEGDGGLTGQDRRPCLDPETEGRHSIDELESRAHGSLSVILVGCRRSPDRHDRIADELLDRAAVSTDHVPGEVKVPAQELP
jgi:hypothetical protein